jgi:hypothetical protein
MDGRLHLCRGQPITGGLPVPDWRGAENPLMQRNVADARTLVHENTAVLRHIGARRQSLKHNPRHYRGKLLETSKQGTKESDRRRQFSPPIGNVDC